VVGDDIEWWQDRIDEGYDTFNLQEVELPCCGHPCTLNDLRYGFEQGFSRWGVDVMNPSIGKLDDATVARFESILGCMIKVVYQHV